MPTLSSADLLTASVLSKWRQTVASEVDDLVSWLTASPADRPFYRPSAEPPGSLYGHTSHLFGWLAVNLPGVNGAHLMRLYDVLLCWHQEADADNLPDKQSVLRLADAAIITADAILSELRKRSEVEQVGAVVPAPPAATWLSSRDLAKNYGLSENIGALDKRLKRWRMRNGNGWIEIPDSDRRPREPKYLYDPKAVAEIIDAMKTER